VVDDPVHLINLPDHLGPALGRDGPDLLLSHPQRKSSQTRLPDLPLMGVGVEAVIAHRDLPLVGDTGSDPGDELQVVHPHHLSGLFPIPVADLAFFLIEAEAFQGQERPNHVFAHSLSLFPCLGPDVAMDIDPVPNVWMAEMTPGISSLPVET